VSVRNSLLTRRALLGTGAALGLTRAVLRAQEPRPTFRVKVDMVVLQFHRHRLQGALIGERPEAHRVQDPRRRHPTEDRPLSPRAASRPFQLLEGGATRPLGSAEADAF